ncbi:hypothetical protein B0H14DRAFT_3640629 [Mycena olivaceomarginata]|nr:hypothetical protein B0H14DRAFT_3640629 [Mycena olivaceomarginata]
MTRGLISADGKPDTPAVQRGHSLAPTVVPRLVLCPRSPALPQPSPLDAHGDSSQLLSRPHRTLSHSGLRPAPPEAPRPRRRTHATHLFAHVWRQPLPVPKNTLLSHDGLAPHPSACTPLTGLSTIPRRIWAAVPRPKRRRIPILAVPSQNARPSPPTALISEPA